MDITERLRSPVRYGTETQEQAKARHFRERHEAADEILKLRELLRCCRTWIDPKETGDTDSESLCWQVDDALPPNAALTGAEGVRVEGTVMQED